MVKKQEEKLMFSYMPFFMKELLLNKFIFEI
jgi:hypothetical protein